MMNYLRGLLDRPGTIHSEIAGFVSRVRESRDRAACELENSQLAVDELKRLQEIDTPFEHDMFPREAINTGRG